MLHTIFVLTQVATTTLTCIQQYLSTLHTLTWSSLCCLSQPLLAESKRKWCCRLKRSAHAAQREGGREGAQLEPRSDALFVLHHMCSAIRSNPHAAAY